MEADCTDKERPKPSMPLIWIRDGGQLPCQLGTVVFFLYGYITEINVTNFTKLKQPLGMTSIFVFTFALK